MFEALLVLVLVGLALYLLLTYVPMPPPFKTVIIALAVIFLVVWLLQGFGLISPMRWRG